MRLSLRLFCVSTLLAVACSQASAQYYYPPAPAPGYPGANYPPGQPMPYYGPMPPQMAPQHLPWQQQPYMAPQQQPWPQPHMPYQQLPLQPAPHMPYQQLPLQPAPHMPYQQMPLQPAPQRPWQAPAPQPMPTPAPQPKEEPGKQPATPPQPPQPKEQPKEQPEKQPETPTPQQPSQPQTPQQPSQQQPPQQPSEQQPSQQQQPQQPTAPTPGMEGNAPPQAGAQPEAQAAAAGAESPTPMGNAFVQAPASGTSGAEGFNPTMFGDIVGPGYLRTFTRPTGSTFAARVPFAARGNFKIAEGESPRPLDRIYFNYNSFDRIHLDSQDSSLSRADLDRQTIGFEKTFLDCDASIGMRLPIFQLSGDGSVDQNGFGDLSIILKYALINDCETGNVLSTGVVVTLPTGADDLPGTFAETIHSTLYQPFIGYLCNGDDCYIHGFSSVVFPSDDRDVTLLFNDVGIGYWWYRTHRRECVTGIVPTLEAHVTTPLNHRGLRDNAGLVAEADTISVTGGCTFEFEHAATLGLAIGAPLTGPRPYDLEALLQLNWRF